uniref:ATP synthase F0 subunit 8 n=1 Tax=Scoloplos cf. armiger CB-2006 TaxID=375448 RepID=Q19NV3_9ANNE|nr:ATP synthase F0 subunit 8 [Scoloplos cf. armiger CB-2006]
MPHLAPLNWINLPILFWLSFLTLMSMFWWTQSPKISFSKPLTSKQSLPWNW